MKTEEIAKQLFIYIQASEWDKVSELLDKNFTFSGQTPRPLDKEEFIIHHKELKKAFSSWEYNLSEVTFKEEGRVRGILQVNCHHTGTFYPKIWNTPILYPTHKYISLPKESFDLWTDNGLVIGIIAYPEPHGGMMELIRQAGSRVPIFD